MNNTMTHFVKLSKFFFPSRVLIYIILVLLLEIYVTKTYHVCLAIGPTNSMRFHGLQIVHCFTFHSFFETPCGFISDFSTSTWFLNKSDYNFWGSAYSRHSLTSVHAAFPYASRRKTHTTSSALSEINSGDANHYSWWLNSLTDTSAAIEERWRQEITGEETRSQRRYAKKLCKLLDKPLSWPSALQRLQNCLTRITVVKIKKTFMSIQIAQRSAR